MVISDLKVGDVVRDRWFREWGYGEVKEVKKTVVHIYFTGLHKRKTFDKDHIKFLERVNVNNLTRK